MPKRILIIDDEDDIREVAAASLEAIGGHQVVTAFDGRDGVQKAISQAPDVILLDVMMPDRDGPAVLLDLRQNGATRDIPVVFLTAKVQPAERQRLTKLGAQGVVAKPFDPMAISDQLAALLGW